MHFARITRHLEVPASVRVVTVGGATLGGSGKTPLSVAITRHIASLGVRTVLVSHAYGAKGARAAWTSPLDDARVVGDEAVASADRLQGSGARVVSAKRRQEAVDFASEWAELVVLDGPLQLAPRRADASVLALSADRPWGAGACLPRGDLRAPPSALLACADLVAEIGDEGERGASAHWVFSGARSVDGSRAYSVDELRGLRLGLVTNVARPERIVRTLARAGLVPVRHVALGDHSHARLDSSMCDNVAIDLWLAPSKTRQAATCPRAAWLSARLRLSEAFASALESKLGLGSPRLDPRRAAQ